MDLQDIKTPGLSCDLHDNPDIKERELALSHNFDECGETGKIYRR